MPLRTTISQFLHVLDKNKQTTHQLLLVNSPFHTTVIWKWVLEFSAPLRCRHPPDLSNPFSGKDNFSLFMSSHNRKSTVLGTFWTILTCWLRALYFAFKNTLWVHNYLPLRDEWFRSAGKLKKISKHFFLNSIYMPYIYWQFWWKKKDMVYNVGPISGRSHVGHGLIGK